MNVFSLGLFFCVPVGVLIGMMVDTDYGTIAMGVVDGESGFLSGPLLGLLMVLAMHVECVIWG